MRIVRYNNEQVQRQLGSKAKPEPWLHVCISDAYPNGESMYAIYVWDTRQIVETGKCKPSAGAYNTRALDNHKPLVGKDADQFDFSKHSFALKNGVMAYASAQGVRELVDGTSPYCNRLCVLEHSWHQYASGIGGINSYAILYVGPKGEGFTKRSEMQALLRRLASEKAKRARNTAKLKRNDPGYGLPGMSGLDFKVMTLQEAVKSGSSMHSDTPKVSYDVD